MRVGIAVYNASDACIRWSLVLSDLGLEFESSSVYILEVKRHCEPARGYTKQIIVKKLSSDPTFLAVLRLGELKMTCMEAVDMLGSHEQTTIELKNNKGKGREFTHDQWCRIKDQEDQGEQECLIEAVRLALLDASAEFEGY